jgi:hypothetical protein
MDGLYRFEPTAAFVDDDGSWVLTWVPVGDPRDRERLTRTVSEGAYELLGTKGLLWPDSDVTEGQIDAAIS